MNLKYNNVLHALQSLTKVPITQTKLAEILECSPQTINKRAIRNSNFTESEINSLENYFNTSFSYLDIDSNSIEGISKMIDKITSQNRTRPRDGEFAEIPIRGEVSASMGHGLTVYSEEQTATYKISRELVRDLGISANSSEMILASGDSMEPTIEGGDSLLIDLSKKEVYDGRIFCVRIDRQLYAKRLQKIPPHKIKVISDNKEKYDPFYIDFSQKIDFDFEIIGEIRWWGRVAK